MGRIACLDYGLARIGVALSDNTKIIVAKSFVVQAEKKTEFSAKKIVETFSAYEIEKIIIGMPLHLDGRKSFLTDETQYFISHLEKYTPIPIIRIDERLSTKYAEKVLLEANMTRKKRSKIIDAVTATILLEGYLDSLIFSA